MKNKVIAEIAYCNHRAKTEPAVFTGNILEFFSPYVRDMYFCTTGFAVDGDEKSRASRFELPFQDTPSSIQNGINLTEI